MDSDLARGIASPDKQDLKEFMDNDLNAELKPKGIILQVESDEKSENPEENHMNVSKEKSHDSIDDIIDDHLGSANNLFLSSTAKKFDKVVASAPRESQISNITPNPNSPSIDPELKPT